MSENRTGRLISVRFFLDRYFGACYASRLITSSSYRTNGSMTLL